MMISGLGFLRLTDEEQCVTWDDDPRRGMGSLGSKHVANKPNTL